ncbi:Catalase OS=Streptomyces tendae OX=1932 GN=GUR47_23465 PE=3 SV=1 [Streptomyces tendae]
MNAPVVDVRTYSKDGAMAYRKTTHPVYAPNSKGGPAADTERFGTPPSWETDGAITRTAYVSHAEDDDWRSVRAPWCARYWTTRPGTGWSTTWSAAFLNGVTEPVLQPAFEYWSNIDKTIGDRIAKGVRAKAGEKDFKADEQGNPARRSMQDKA